MNNPSQEDLLGYVLGALDAQEQRDLQTQIDQNPQLEEELLRIKSSVLPLDCLEATGLRPGLARRTCEMVASYQADVDQDEFNDAFDANESDYNPGQNTSPQRKRVSHSSENTSSQRKRVSENTSSKRKRVSHLSALTSSVFDDSTEGRADWSERSERRFLQPSTWAVPDFIVAVAMMAIVAGILLPTISYTRYNSRLMACQNNMREIGTAFMQFSESNLGCFVEIPRSGPLAASGCFAPILKDAGLIDDDNIFACAGVSNKTPMYIPSIETVMNARGEQLAHLQRIMAGNFGYTMGYCDDNGYCAPRSLGRTNVVLLADMPSLNGAGRISSNHSGVGQNCLFEDGHVDFVRGDSIGEDAIFVNDYNLVAPGCRPGDNVIAPSHLSPMVAELMAKGL